MGSPFLVTILLSLLLFADLEETLFGRDADMRVINGTDAQQSDFHYLATILIKINRTNDPKPKLGFGGGSIIGDRWILTARHAAVHSDNFAEDGPVAETSATVYPKYPTKKLKKFFKEKGYKVAKRFCQPFKKGESHFVSDIAVLKLQDPIPLETDPHKFRKIDLADKFDEHGNVTVMGWGFTNHSYKVPDKIQMAHLKIMDKKECADITGISSDGNRTFCVGGSTNVCNGDSGGPGVAKDEKGTESQIGVIAAAPPNCSIVGVFVNTITYRDWINEIMNSEPEKYECKVVFKDRMSSSF
ncbi:chymotrypsinogen A-like [Brevipalpus obovatus]|uniref:chymotrypsinogen A-like n=1 Tax=Brevipalpus obovatus TaxID=246614 RepID=UPI003D9F42E7